MTVQQYIEWLDKEIKYCHDKQKKSAKGGDDSLLWYNRMVAYGSAKSQFLTIDFTSQTTESEQNNFTNGLE